MNQSRQESLDFFDLGDKPKQPIQDEDKDQKTFNKTWMIVAGLLTVVIICLLMIGVVLLSNLNDRIDQLERSGHRVKSVNPQTFESNQEWLDQLNGLQSNMTALQNDISVLQSQQIVKQFNGKTNAQRSISGQSVQMASVGEVQPGQTISMYASSILVSINQGLHKVQQSFAITKDGVTVATCYDMIQTNSKGT